MPVILSKEEIERLISATKNINYRLIIQVGFSSGVRVSEEINFRMEDIDFNRNLIHLKKAKGKKDRIVMPSKKVEEGLLNLSVIRQGMCS